MTINRLTALTVCALGTSTVCAQTVQYDVQLVLDNDPRLSAIGVDYGTRSLLPGPSATAVGITLIARVAVVDGTGGVGNFGITSMTGRTGFGGANTRFVHSDSISDQTSPLWTSPSLAFQRGFTAATGAARGVMSVPASPQIPNSIPVNFRALLVGNAINNQPNTNAALSTPPVEIGSISPGTRNENGWIGVVNGSAAILAVNPIRLPTLVSDPFGEWLPTPPNFGTSGEFSPWYAMYHLVFVPRTNNGGAAGVERDVTVSVSGFFTHGIAVTEFAGAWSIVRSQPSSLQSASITFTVPTPGAMAVLGLGGLFACRRRR